MESAVATANRDETRLEGINRAISNAIGVAVAGVGLTVLVGWALDIPLLKSVFPGFVTMKANTALAFFLTGTALCLLQEKRATPVNRRLANICAAVVAGIGLLTLAEYFLGWDIGIDQLLFKESGTPALTTFPGRMAPVTAINFFLIGGSLLLLYIPAASNAVQGLMLLEGGISLLAFIGYLYGAPTLYFAITTYTTMAVHTAVVFLAIFLGVSFARPDRGWMTIYTSSHAGGVLVRRFIPVVILYPFFSAMLLIWGRNRGLYNDRFEESLHSVGIIVFFSVIFTLVAQRLNQLDAKRARAQREVETTNRTLLAVSNCNQALVRATDEQQLMDDVCRVLTETGGYRMAWVGLAEHDAEKTVRTAAFSGHNEGYLETLKITWADTERGRGPTGTAIRTNKPVVCHDIATYPFFAVWRSEAQKRGYISSAAIPLTDGNAVIGSLNIYSGKADAFDAEEMRLLAELAADLSFGITHQWMMKNRERTQRELDLGYRIAQIFLADKDDEMYADVLTIILDAMKSRYGIFGYINEAGDLICPSMTRDVYEKCNVPEKTIVFPRATWGGLWGRSLVERKTLYSNSPYRVPDGHIPITRSISTPIIYQDKLVGHLHVANKESDYDEGDVRLMNGLAAIIAPVLASKLEKQAHEATRIKAEGVVKASETRYRAFFDQSPFGVVIIDAETALPLEFNDVACRQLGYTREEFATLRVGDYEVKETPEETKRRFAEVLKEGTATFETKHRAKKGEIRDVLVAVRTVALDGKPLFYCIFQDITDRKKAEEALQSIKWLLKSDTEGENGALTKIGEKYEPYYGDLVKLNTEGEIRNSVDKDILNNIVKDYLDLLGTSSAIYEKNGDYAIGIFSSNWCRFMDTASRKQCGTDDNRDALARGKWLCHESCWSDASKVSIKEGKPIDIECHGGIRLHAVPIRAGGENIGSINFGYGSPPPDPEELKKIAERYSVDIEEITKYAKEYQSRPPFIVELAKKRLRASANLIGVLVERKRAEVALRSANEELKTAATNMEKTQAVLLRQEKLASIGTLSAGVAHEILNPLNIIGTITQLMQMDEWPEKTKENLDEIMAQIKRATKITNNLRMFAHVHKREITAVDVHALFDKTTTLIEHDLNLDNITVDRDYDQNLPLIFVDQDLLAQVFLNLLNNARHALQEVKDRKKSISIKTRAIDGTVEIRLSNNGPRIPEDIIGHIFDPFFTTKDPNKGTGLGLSMAHTFIRDFGGSITVQNEAPEGVTFIITLPAKGKENENTGG